MRDHHVQMQFDVATDREGLRRWLTSPDGIAGWWSDTVEGAAGAEGDEFRVTFPTTAVVFELVVAEMGDDRIEWSVPVNPPWWAGTAIRFDLSDRDEGGTLLLVSHRGFEPDDPVVAVITPAWVRFIDNLVAVAESGEPDPAVVN